MGYEICKAEEVRNIEVQQMQTVQKSRFVSPMGVVASVFAAAAFALSEMAGADDVSQLTAAATSGGDSIKAAVITIAITVIGIALVWWGASKLKPKG